MKIRAAAIQMPSAPMDVAANLGRADALLRQAHDAGAELAVLPELFNSGYGMIPDYTPFGESLDGRGLPEDLQDRYSRVPDGRGCDSTSCLDSCAIFETRSCSPSRCLIRQATSCERPTQPRPRPIATAGAAQATCETATRSASFAERNNPA